MTALLMIDCRPYNRDLSAFVCITNTGEVNRCGTRVGQSCRGPRGRRGVEGPARATLRLRQKAPCCRSPAAVPGGDAKSDCGRACCGRLPTQCEPGGAEPSRCWLQGAAAPCEEACPCTPVRSPLRWRRAKGSARWGRRKCAGRARRFIPPPPSLRRLWLECLGAPPGA